MSPSMDAIMVLVAGWPDADKWELAQRLAPELANIARIPPATTISKRFLSVAEAKTYTRMGRWTFGRFTTAGKLPCVKLSAAKSGKVLYELRDLDKLMASMKTRAKAPTPTLTAK